MNLRRYGAGVVGALFLAIAAGCGGASNDQGVSFLLTGYYDDQATSISDPSHGLSGLLVPFTSDPGATSDNEPAGSTGLLADGSVPAKIGLQNNLDGIGIRVQRAFLSYNIPGAGVQPPSTSFALNGALSPATSTSGSSSAGFGGSDLPPGFGGGRSEGLFQIPVVPHEIREWIAFNRNALPEPPFTMDVTTTVTGLSTAGARLDTNSETLSVIVTPDDVIPPTNTGGSGGGTSSDTGSSSSAGVFDGSGLQ